MERQPWEQPERTGFNQYLERPILGVPVVNPLEPTDLSGIGIAEKPASPASTANDVFTGYGPDFTTNIIFTVVDNDTVSWGTGVISFRDGSASPTIAAGNTGNMGAKTYIYYDPQGVRGALSTTGVYDDAVTGERILLATATPNADTTKMAELITIGISGLYVASLIVSHITSGTIKSKQFTLDVTEGGGDTFFASGKTDFTNVETGFILGIDDSDSNTPKFYIGNATQYLNWTGSALNIAGALSAGTIDIGGADTTSFHVDADGNMWLGAALYNITTNPFAVSNAGVLRAVSGTIGGWTLGATSLADTAGLVGMSSAVTAGDDIRFWAGHVTPASAPFRVTEAGLLTATSATISGSISATSGTIGGWTINAASIADNATEANAKILLDSANTLIRVGPTSGNYITIDGDDLEIESSNYASGPLGAGFHIDTNLAEFENIRARGKISTSVFEKDTISSVGGKLLVTNADILNANMTALDASTLTVLGDVTFAVNDILVIADGVDTEYLRVTNIGSAPVYTVTRDLAGAYGADANPVWKKGTCVSVLGSSNGVATYSGGWLYMLGAGTNSPYYAVQRRTGVAYNAYSDYARLGNLNGFLDYATDIYGFGVGDTNNYISIDPTNNLRIVSSNTNAITINAGGNIALKFGGSLIVSEVPNPSACVAALAGEDGVVTEGNHYYKVTFVTPPVGGISYTSETDFSAESNLVTTVAGNKKVNLSSIPLGTLGNVTQRKIYRTKIANSSEYFLLTTINNNTATTYQDNTADDDLGTAAIVYRDNTTSGRIIFGSYPSFLSTNFNTFVGNGCGTYLTSGINNVSAGNNSLWGITEGIDNTGMGCYSGQNITTGNYNTCIGMNAGRSISTSSYNIHLGAYAGYYVTDSGIFSVNSYFRSNLADEQAKSLLYGQMGITVASQWLQVNGTLQVDHINEAGAGHGVVIDGVQLKDGGALSIVGGTNTFSLTNGSASLDIAASSAVDVNANLTVESASFVNQDLTSDASPTFNQGNFTTVHTTTILADHIGEHTAAHGVVFDNDVTRVGKVSVDHIAEATGSHKIVLDNDFQRVGIGYIDHIAEATGAHKVVFDNDFSRVGTGYVDHLAEATGSHTVVVDSTLTLAGNALNHDASVAADLTVENLDQDKDIIFKVNDGGSSTEVARLDGANSALDITKMGDWDGWQDAEGSWSYASASTINVPSGATSKYKIGDKIKITQPTLGTKYFYVTTVASTLLTVSGGSDYTVANEAITNPCYSHVENPSGFPDWFNYTLTSSTVTFGNATVTSRFRMSRLTVLLNIYIVFGNSTSISGGGQIRFGLPVTPVSNTNPVNRNRWFGVAWGWDSNLTTFFHGNAMIVSADTTTEIGELRLGNSVTALNISTDTFPVTWTTSDEIGVQMEYRVG